MKPVYQLRPGGIAIAFKRPAFVQEDGRSVIDGTQNGTQSGTQNSAQNGTQNSAQNEDENKNNARQKQMVEYIAQNNQISTETLATLLKISVRTVKRELKAIGYQWSGSAKTGHWEKKK